MARPDAAEAEDANADAPASPPKQSLWTKHRGAFEKIMSKDEEVRRTALNALEAKDEQLMANMKRSSAAEQVLRKRVAKLQESVQQKDAQIQQLTSQLTDAHRQADDLAYLLRNLQIQMNANATTGADMQKFMEEMITYKKGQYQAVQAAAVREQVLKHMTPLATKIQQLSRCRRELTHTVKASLTAFQDTMNCETVVLQQLAGGHAPPEAAGPVGVAGAAGAKRGSGEIDAKVVKGFQEPIQKLVDSTNRVLRRCGLFGEAVPAPAGGASAKRQMARLQDAVEDVVAALDRSCAALTDKFEALARSESEAHITEMEAKQVHLQHEAMQLADLLIPPGPRPDPLHRSATAEGAPGPVPRPGTSLGPAVPSGPVPAARCPHCGAALPPAPSELPPPGADAGAPAGAKAARSVAGRPALLPLPCGQGGPTDPRGRRPDPPPVAPAGNTAADHAFRDAVTSIEKLVQASGGAAPPNHRAELQQVLHDAQGLMEVPEQPEPPLRRRARGIKKDSKAVERFEAWKEKRRAVLEKRQRLLETLCLTLRQWVLEDRRRLQPAAPPPASHAPPAPPQPQSRGHDPGPAAAPLLRGSGKSFGLSAPGGAGTPSGTGPSLALLLPMAVHGCPFTPTKTPTALGPRPHRPPHAPAPDLQWAAGPGEAGPPAEGPRALASPTQALPRPADGGGPTGRSLSPLQTLFAQQPAPTGPGALQSPQQRVQEAARLLRSFGAQRPGPLEGAPAQGPAPEVCPEVGLPIERL